MDVAALKLDLIHWLTQVQDETLLKKIHLLKEEREERLDLSEDQLLELEKRLEKYENGQMEFSSWESVKERIRSRSKNEI